MHLAGHPLLLVPAFVCQITDPVADFLIEVCEPETQ